MPKISVIIPVYKTEKYVKKCVESVLAQDFTDYEIIIVDDKSPDGAGKICDGFKDSRITVIHLKENGGISNARNVAIARATGDYIMFLDSDDSINQGAVSHMYNLATDTDCDEVICGYNIVVERDGEEVSTRTNFVESTVLNGKKEIAEEMFLLKEKVMIDPLWNKLYKRSIITDNNVIMPVGEIFEDTEFNIRLLKYTEKIVITDKCFYNYMQREQGSLTKSFNPKKTEFLKKRSETFKDYLTENGLFEGKTKQKCNYFYIKYIFSSIIDLNFPTSGLNRSQIYEYIKKEIGSEEFKNAISECNAEGRTAKIVILCAKTRSSVLINLFCRLTYILKYKMRFLFFKIK